jgi:electron transfer flavoprotein-quinone oxidoreductase
MGIIVRGMDLAIGSGVLAAEAIKAAKKSEDYSARSLMSYEALLNNSFVMKDLRTFRNVWSVLNNPRLFTKYPEAVTSLMKDFMFIRSESKPKFSSTTLKHFRKNFLNLAALKDVLNLMKI